MTTAPARRTTDGPTDDPRAEAVLTQAREQAERARRVGREKRGAVGGVAGRLADRAGDWELADDPQRWLGPQRYLWNTLADRWFRMEVDGWENIPPGPCLLIGVHAGAPFVWDAWTVSVHWWRRFGHDRPLHGTAHDLLMGLPVYGHYFRAMGVLPAAPDSMLTALADGHDVILWPGGDTDALRPWWRRDEAVLAGRTGFVKIAIKAGVPVVPVATTGGADAAPVVVPGDKVASLLRLDKLLRLKSVPLSVSVPWGLAPSLLPQIPLPAKIRTRFMPPVHVEPDLELTEDDDYLRSVHDEVLASLQSGMDALARRRKFPLFG